MLNETGTGSAGTMAEEFSGSTSSDTYCSRCAMEPVNGNGKYCTGCNEIVRAADVDDILARSGVSRDQVEGKGGMVTPEQQQLIAFLEKKQKIDAGRVCWSFANKEIDQLSQAEADGFIRYLHSLGKPATEATESIPTPNPTNEPKTDEEPQQANGSAPYTPRFEGDPGPDWVEKLGEDYKAARDEAAIDESDFPDYPAEFVRALVKGDNKITRTEVFSVLAEFGMSVSLGEVAEKADAIVVTDRTQTALMKQARELRLTLRKERLRLEQKRIAVKEPFLRRVQIIDGIGKTIRDLFEEKEKHLLAQEKFIELDDARIAAEKQADRIAALTAFEYEPTVEQMTGCEFGKMTDAEWDAFYTATKNAYDERKAAEAAEAAAKRIEDERLATLNAKLERNAARLREVQALGFIPKDGKLIFFALPETTDVAETAVTESGDADYQATLKYLQNKADELRIVQERNHDRTLQLVDLGMRLDGERYAFETVRVSMADLKEQSAIEWAQTVETAAAAIQAIKDEKNKADIAAEAARIAAEKEAKEQAEKEEAERQAAMAPDKEKLVAFANAIDAVAVPAMSNDMTRQLIGQCLTKIKAATDTLRRQASQI